MLKSLHETSMVSNDIFPVNNYKLSNATNDCLTISMTIYKERGVFFLFACKYIVNNSIIETCKPGIFCAPSRHYHECCNLLLECNPSPDKTRRNQQQGAIVYCCYVRILHRGMESLFAVYRPLRRVYCDDAKS